MKTSYFVICKNITTGKSHHVNTQYNKDWAISIAMNYAYNHCGSWDRELNKDVYATDTHMVYVTDKRPRL